MLEAFAAWFFWISCTLTLVLVF